MKRTKFIALMLAASAMFSYSEPVKVDIGKNTGRGDTKTKGWEEWQVPDGSAATREFDGINVTLRTSNQNGLQGIWNKGGLATGATMATDGIAVFGGGGPAEIKLILEELKPGRHSLVTYHNFVDDTAIDLVTLSHKGDIAGMATMPSRQVSHNHQAASLYTEFTVKENEAAVIRLANTEEVEPRVVVLNGFEIDSSNPKKRALNPTPAQGEIHADGDNGYVKLAWQPANGAVYHRLYFADGHSREAARTKAAQANKGAPPYRGTFYRSRFNAPVKAGESLTHYAWRVDSIDDEGKVTKGDVWDFRVRKRAFPGAEGYGCFALGGRGGRIIKVTNLNDSGPGSLRAAVEAKGPRTVVFDVSGRIVLKDTLVVRNPFLTIAGHTAPGKGICISNYNLGLIGTHDVIIRHLRVRPGDTAGETLDGMGMASSNHVIFDHCSISWTQDEVFSSRAAKNITLQRTLISEALNIAGHENYEKGKQHGYAASIGGDIGSFHHNLLAHCAGRNWSLAGGLDQANRHTGRLDIRNNVVYNWGHRTTDGGAHQVNFVNNYYKPGPASSVFHVLKPERKLVPLYGPQEYYVRGNVMAGYYGADKPYAGIVAVGEELVESYLVEAPFFPSYVTTHTAQEAYQNVLADVGATRPILDEHDQRVIQEVKTGTITYEGSVSGLPGLPDSQEDTGGWENYPTIHRPDSWDGDHDGIADAWEKAHGLDAGNSYDSRKDRNGDGYTNLEEYLHWLAAGNHIEDL